MKVDYKLIALGALLLSVAAFVNLHSCGNSAENSTTKVDSVVILKDSLSKFQNLNSKLEHEKLEISRKLAIANNRNASLLTVMESINNQLSRQPKSGSRVREQRPQTPR